jgi:hypothetical protein
MLYIWELSNKFDLNQSIRVSHRPLKSHKDHTGSAKANGREPKTCLGRVFNYKLGCFEDVYETHVCGHMLRSVVENSAQVSSC